MKRQRFNKNYCETTLPLGRTCVELTVHNIIKKEEPRSVLLHYTLNQIILKFKKHVLLSIYKEIA